MDWNKMGAVGSLGSFLVGLVLFGVQVWPWPTIKSAKSLSSIVPISGIGAIVIFMIIGFVLAGLSLYGSSRTNRNGVEFFENRDELNLRSGGLSSELEGVRRAWVMWPAGGSAVALIDERFKSIDKLLLMNPNLLAMEYAETFKAEGASAVANSIKELTKRAQRLHVPVLWYPYPYLSIIINDPTSDTAWARIELLLPGVEAGHRPSMKVTKSIHPHLFGKLIEMYDFMWKKSMKPF
jgi:hypothetical protein